MAAMSTPVPFRPGDLLPALSLPDAAGQPFDLMQQSIAGKPRLLVLGRPAPAALLAEAEARGAVPILVAPQKPDGARRTARGRSASSTPTASCSTGSACRRAGWR
jgi:hypothetical protein